MSNKKENKTQEPLYTLQEYIDAYHLTAGAKKAIVAKAGSEGLESKPSQHWDDLIASYLNQ